MAATKDFSISEWDTPSIGRGTHIISEEVFPKSVVNILIKSMNNKIVEGGLTNFNAGLGATATRKKVTTQKAIVRHILKKSTKLDIDPDHYVSFTTEYCQQARNGRMGPLGSKGMICVSKTIRATLCKDTYDDVDMCNAHPFLLQQFIKNLNFTENLPLTEYIENREETLALVCSETRCDRAAAKTELLRIMNGGSSEAAIDRYDTTSFIHRYFTSMTWTLHSIYELCQTVPAYKMFLDKDRKNPQGATMNHIIIELENKCLQSMCQKFTQIGHKVDSLCYDGCMIRRVYNHEVGKFNAVTAVTAVTPDDLLNVEQHVFDVTGYHITLAIKPFANGLDLEAVASTISDKTEPPSNVQMVQDFYGLKHNNILVFGTSVAVYREDIRLWSIGDFNKSTIGQVMAEDLKLFYISDMTNSELLGKTIRVLETGAHLSSIGNLLLTDINNLKPTDMIQDFNRKEPWLIPYKDKVIDTRTLETRDRVKEDMFTFSIDRNFIPDCDTSSIDEFFSAYMKYTDPETAELILDVTQYESLKRAYGYSITGNNNQKMIIFEIGVSDTGKSSCHNCLGEFLGNSEMYSVINENIIVERKAAAEIQTEHAALEKGLRWGYCSEFNSNHTFNTENLKRLTGEDTINYRPMRSNVRSYRNCTKLWIFCNKAPILPTTSDPEAFVSRMTTYNFRNVFNKANTDPTFLNFGKTHRDEGFTWLVQLAHEYYKSGESIPISESMKLFKMDILREQNPLQDFADHFTPLYPFEDVLSSKPRDIKKTWLTSSTIYSRYALVTEKPLTQRAFETKLTTLLPLNLSCDLMIDNKRVKRVYAYSFSESTLFNKF